jgi:hypothetical protein
MQYFAKNQSTQRCQSLITPRNDHPSVIEPHIVLITLFARPLKHWLLLALPLTIIGQLDSGTVKVHFTWTAQFSVDLILLKNSLLQKFGRFLMGALLLKLWALL